MYVDVFDICYIEVFQDMTVILSILIRKLLSLDNYYGNVILVKHDKDLDLMKIFMKVSHDRESSLRF